jgi:hypothetical protein
VTDQTKERDHYFHFFSERVASKAGASGKKEIMAAAFLCGTAVVPALKNLFEDATKPKDESPSTPTAVVDDAPEVQDSPSTTGAGYTTSLPAPDGTTGEGLIKLISVMSRAQGEEEVETWWGLHPQFRRDLPPDEAKELAKHMNRATRIVGERFAIVVSLAQGGASRPVGNA